MSNSAKNITGKKVPKVKKKGVKEMGTFLDKLGTLLPKDYKFDREEANER